MLYFKPQKHHSVRSRVSASLRKLLTGLASAIAHPADPGTQELFQILKNIPNKENRVIGAITKCDRKQEDAEDWVTQIRSSNDSQLIVFRSLTQSKTSEDIKIHISWLKVGSV
jgi:hypothetical protein